MQPQINNLNKRLKRQSKVQMMIAQIKKTHHLIMMMMTKMMRMMIKKKKVGGIGDLIFN